MAIEDTDTLLVNRDGASYKVAISDFWAKVREGDLALANRNGSSYKLTGGELKTRTFNDTDLFMLERDGASYKVTGSELKPKFVKPVPPITAASIGLGTSPEYTGDFTFFSVGATFNEWYNDTAIDETLPTEVRLKLISDHRWYEPISLTSPAPQIAGATSAYDTKHWSYNQTPEVVTFAPGFNFSYDGSRIEFTIKVPTTVKVDGVDMSVHSSGIAGGIWTGTLGVYQYGKGNTVEFQPFECKDSYFN